MAVRGEAESIDGPLGYQIDIDPLVEATLATEETRT